jgi:hypothetical protein
MDAQWQVLHQRVALGEALTGAEQVLYDTGCQALDADERVGGNLNRLLELRAQIAEAEAEQQLLRERETELDARIMDLERHLDQRTRQLLGVSN